MEETQTCVEVQMYGGGTSVVCGAQAPEEHEPVDTAFTTFNPVTVSFVLIALSAASFLFAKKVNDRFFKGGEKE